MIHVRAEAVINIKNVAVHNITRSIGSYLGLSAPRPLIFLKQRFIKSGDLGHVGQRDDRFIYFDRARLLRIDLPADSGDGQVLAQHLPCEAILVGTRRVVADAHLHLIGPGQLAIAGEEPEDLQAAVQFDPVCFLQFDPLHILYVLVVDALGVTVQCIKWGEDLSPPAAIHLGMLPGEIVKALVLRTSGEECRCVFESDGESSCHDILPYYRQDQDSGFVPADLKIALACGPAVHVVETAQQRI